MGALSEAFSLRMPTAFKFRGSVVKFVAPKVVFFIFWTTFICVLDAFVVTNQNLRLPTTLISLLGLVISLLLVFRTNTAYDRYWEGRVLWSSMTTAIRSAARTIWVHVKETNGESDREIKRKTLHLLIAFAYACMHHLRDEYGVQLDDMKDLIEHLPDYKSKSVNAPRVSLTENRSSNLPGPSEVQVELPLLITHNISCFMQNCLSTGAIPPPVFTTLLSNLNAMGNSLTGFERIRNTPIPTAYAVHLSQSIWLFSLFLPFQILLINPTWLAIVIVAISVFTMFGIINIGEEIENPFGFDANDLPLNEYCEILHSEIDAIISRPPPNIDAWVKYTSKVI